MSPARTAPVFRTSAASVQNLNAGASNLDRHRSMHQRIVAGLDCFIAAWASASSGEPLPAGEPTDHIGQRRARASPRRSKSSRAARSSKRGRPGGGQVEGGVEVGLAGVGSVWVCAKPKQFGVVEVHPGVLGQLQVRCPGGRGPARVGRRRSTAARGRRRRRWCRRLVRARARCRGAWSASRCEPTSAVGSGSSAPSATRPPIGAEGGADQPPHVEAVPLG